MSNNNNGGSSKHSNRNRKRSRGAGKSDSQPNQKKQKTRKSQTSAAAAYATPGNSSRPDIKSGAHSCRVRHRELVGSVNGSTAFTVQYALAINPGLQATFPWLSLMAAGYEQYKFHSLKFRYLTRCGTSTPGSVLLAPDYDASEASPVSEQVTAAFQNCVEDAPWKDMVCSLDAKSMNRSVERHYTRNGAIPLNSDIKLYDVASLFVCAVDGVADFSWGKLWVEYDIEFFSPQLNPTGAPFTAGGKITGGGTLTAANPLGTNPTVEVGTTGILASNLSLVTIANPGTYLVTVDYLCTAYGAFSLAPIVGQGTSITMLFNSTDANGLTAVWRVVTIIQNASIDFELSASAVTASQAIIVRAPFQSI